MTLPEIPCLLRNQPGADTLDAQQLVQDRVGMIELYPFDRAFCAAHPVDLHFLGTGYRLVDSDRNFDDQYPRCNKPVLPRIRAMGNDLLAFLMTIDYDNPNHCDWTEELIKQTALALEGAQSILQHAAAMYTTTHGLRFVFALQDPIPVDEAERYHIGLCRKLQALGLAVDLGCSDWTRLMRLPKVVRGDGKTKWNTEEDSFFSLEIHERFFDVKGLIVPADRVSSSDYGTIPKFEQDKPEMPSSIEQVTHYWDDNRNKVQEPWYKRAKKRLRGRESFSAIFEHEALAPTGARDSTIHKATGEVAAMLVTTPDFEFKPEHVFWLLLDPVRCLEVDEQEPWKDWTDVLWTAVGKYWSLELAKKAKVDEIKITTAKETREIQETVLAGVRKWCDAPEVHLGNDFAWDWISRRMIAVIDDFHYVMGPTGMYDPHPVKPRMLASKIQHMGMDGLVPTTKTVVSGESVSVKAVSAQKIVDQFGVPISAVEATGGSSGSYLRRVGTSSPVLDVQTYQRKLLVPEFNVDVDTWLRLMVNNDEIAFKHLTEWLGYFPAFDEGPICALALTGPPGIGKGMLMQGLAEMLSSEYATNHRVLTRFNGDLMRTPLVVINEGVPYQARPDDIGPAEKFRQLTGGDPILVEEKFKPLVLLKAAPRIILTANNLQIVEMLAGGRDLSPFDREAISARILHIDCSGKAAQWLAQKGGRAFTGRAGRRWVRGTGDAQSDYIIARHIYHYYVNRKPPQPGRRLLVDGRPDSEFSQLLATRSGSAPYVVQILVQMIEATTAIEGLVLDQDGSIYVTAHAVTQQAQNSITFSNIRLNNSRVGSVLSALAVGKPKQMKIPASAQSRKRWYKINTTLLLDEAVTAGMDCPRLTRAEEERSPSRATVQWDRL